MRGGGTWQEGGETGGKRRGGGVAEARRRERGVDDYSPAGPGVLTWLLEWGRRKWGVGRGRGGGGGGSQRERQ